MPNLYGSNTDLDQADYVSLFRENSVCPDELKVYPCSLIDHTELMKYYQSGQWQPYTTETLRQLLQFVMVNTPEYCRLTRIIRDISGPMDMGLRALLG
jgi:elongator complex protein 3